VKIALLQPELDEKYSDQKLAYGGGNRPPETGLAVLDYWIRNHSKQKHEITILDSRRHIEDLADEASNYDLLGMSDWFSNHGNVIKIARMAKLINSNLKIALGGPNAANIVQEIFNNHKTIDYIIEGDGEEALLGIADGKNIAIIPNLWYRPVEGTQKFTYRKFISLDDIQLWDFSHFQNAAERLADYLRWQRDCSDPWLVPPLTIFSFRGCPKAMKEGVCKYCTSAETYGRALSPKKFWNQITNLNQKYGAEMFYVSDDIFTISPKRIEDIAKAKPESARARIRAYGYLSDLARLPQSKLENVAKNLERIGVFNLFYGVETYDTAVLDGMNKKGIGIDETIRVIKTLKKKGNVGATIAYVLGLPGESKKSLQTNIDSLMKLVDIDDCLERLYISIGMPLKGSVWYNELQSDSRIRRDYTDETGKDVVVDDDPDYKLLASLSIRYKTSVSPQQVNETVQKMVEIASKRLENHKIGGFMLEI